MLLRLLIRSSSSLPKRWLRVVKSPVRVEIAVAAEQLTAAEIVVVVVVIVVAVVVVVAAVVVAAVVVVVGLAK
jgi:hypothetical protein